MQTAGGFVATRIVQSLTLLYQMLGSVIGLQAALQHSPYAFVEFPNDFSEKKKLA